MSSQTKIVVLHMKEILYTAIFVVLGILLLILFACMFLTKTEETPGDVGTYVPGIYTSSVTLSGMNLEVEVCVDSTHINGIRFSNLDDTVTTMYPLMQPAMESIAQQICESQSLDGINLSGSADYTSQVIFNAIEEGLKKARVNP